MRGGRMDEMKDGQPKKQVDETATDIFPRDVLDAMEDAIHVVDDELQIIFFNDAFRQWNDELGLPSTDVIGTSITELFPFLSEEIANEYRRVFRTGEKLVTEEHVTINGRTIYTETQKIPVVRQGEVAHVVTIIRDITDQKAAERKLRESEALYRGVVEHANDAIYIITPDGFEFVNPTFEELTGYREDEVTAEDFDFWDLLHPDDHEVIRQRERARERGEDIPSRYEFRIIDKQGHVKTVEVTTVDIGAAGEARVMGILRDITDRVQMEEELQEAHNKTTAILEAMPDMMFIQDTDGTYLDFYATDEDKLGVPPDKITGAHIRDVGFTQAKIAEIEEAIQTALDERTIQKIEYGLETPAGRRVFDARIAPLGDDTVLSIVRDITERRRARARLQESNEVLQLTNKIMRHDILNDVQVARSALDLYQDEQDEELLDKLASRLEQSASLINRMQELETLVTAGDTLKPYRVRDVVGDMAEDYDVDVSINGDCTVQADAAFPSVIDNILENAVVHGEADHIDVTMEDQDGRCSLCIADNGTGIPDDVKDRVFEERYSHGGHAGSGLGLYIVRKAIERYGGSVTIEDNEPSGTIVSIHLEQEHPPK